MRKALDRNEEIKEKEAKIRLRSSRMLRQFIEVYLLCFQNRRSQRKRPSSHPNRQSNPRFFRNRSASSRLSSGIDKFPAKFSKERVLQKLFIHRFGGEQIDEAVLHEIFQQLRIGAAQDALGAF